MLEQYTKECGTYIVVISISDSESNGRFLFIS